MVNNKKLNIHLISLIITIVVFLIVSILCLLKYYYSNKIKYVYYNESSNLDYKVYLNDNDFYTTNYLEKNNRYIASLINYIDTDFSYNVNFGSYFNYLYSYKIVADTKVLDKYNKDTIFEKEDTLYESGVYQGIENLKINKNLKIDYNKYNDLIKEFIEVYELDETNCTLDVKMEFNVISSGNEKYEDINKASVVSLSIPLTTKTVAIDMSSDVTSNHLNKVAVKSLGNHVPLLVIGIISFVIFLAYLLILIYYLRKTRSAQEIYHMKLRKLLANYGSDIQVITNDFKIGAVQVIKISSFEDMLEIKETTSSPLLMIENKQKTGAFFIIKTNIDVIYTYALRVADIKAKKEGYEAPDYDLKNINNEINNKKKKYTKEFIDKQLTETIALKGIDSDNVILGNKDKDADIYAQLEETREYRLSELKGVKKAKKKSKDK